MLFCPFGLIFPSKFPSSLLPASGTYHGVLVRVLVCLLESVLLPLTRKSSPLYMIKQYYSSLTANFRCHLLYEVSPELGPSLGPLVALRGFGAVFLSLTTLSFPLVMWHCPPLPGDLSV